MATHTAAPHNISIKEIKDKHPGIDRGIHPGRTGYESIIRDRYKRFVELEEKYILVTILRDGSHRFYQEAAFQGSGGFEWTRYIANARTFDTQMDAELFMVNEVNFGRKIEAKAAKDYI